MELLVSLLIVSVVMAGVVKTLSSHNLIYAEQNIGQDLEQNLRLAMATLTDRIRYSGGDLETVKNFSVWFPWVPSFTANPSISSAPQKISIAVLTAFPVAYLKDREKVKETKIKLIPVSGKNLPDVIDANTKRVILIGDEQLAKVVSASASEITLDTDPAIGGNQGLTRSYAQNTPVYRIDVLTYAIELDPSTYKPRLTVDYNQGAGSTPVADSISAMQITPIMAGQTYAITLTAVSDTVDPVTKTAMTRKLSANVAIRNALSDLSMADELDIDSTDSPDDTVTVPDDPEQTVPLPPGVPPPPPEF
jgi:hypothetical protein